MRAYNMFLTWTVLDAIPSPPCVLFLKCKLALRNVAQGQGLLCRYMLQCTDL